MHGAKGQLLTPSPLHWAWGQRRVVKLPNPAAGKEWSFAGQGSNLVRLLMATWKLKTSAQVANRVPGIAVRDGDEAILGIVSSAQNVAASLTQTVSAIMNGPFDTTGASGITPIGFPPIVLTVGYTLTSNHFGIQTEDQAEGIVLWVEEFEQNPDHPLADLVGVIHKVIQAERAMEYATG